MELDQIESRFRSAWKQAYSYSPPQIKKIALITDKDAAKSELILGNVRTFLSVLSNDTPQWKVLCGDDFHLVSDLIRYCEAEKPDLIVTYRHLWSTEKGLHHSLGVYLDMLTQATDIPILVLPHLEDKDYAEVLKDTHEVMVITDHLSEDPALVNYGVRLTEEGGKLFLAHVEHMHEFKRYLKVIGKIPELNTEIAEAKIATQLLKEPRDFIEACVTNLFKEDIKREVEPLVTFGHTIKTYRELITRYKIDLLILQTKDGDQQAMHGEAYSIAVEFTDTPLLLL